MDEITNHSGGWRQGGGGRREEEGGRREEGGGRREEGGGRREEGGGKREEGGCGDSRIVSGFIYKVKCRSGPKSIDQV